MKPILSIIIPTFNEEKTIQRTIQQFSELRIPHEIIVSDTHSTDRTLEIARQYTERVISLPLDKKRGVSHGRNNGAAEATGAFLVFIDCGAVIPNANTFFETILARFERSPKLVGVSVRIEVEKEMRTWNDAAVSNLMNWWFALLNNVFGFGMASGKFQMIKADIFRKTGGFNELLSTAEDIDLFERLAKFGRTRIMLNLAVYHSGRRFHQQGAWYTLFLWMKNAVSFWTLKKPSDKWDPLR